jgi:nucleosome binding factor SPN SPT16 subunit
MLTLSLDEVSHKEDDEDGASSDDVSHKADESLSGASSDDVSHKADESLSELDPSHSISLSPLPHTTQSNI